MDSNGLNEDQIKMDKEKTTIDLRLFATLSQFIPPNASEYPIERGMTVEQLLARFPFSLSEAKLIFVNGVKKDLQTVLEGGERVGVFPPIGGG